MSKKIFNSAFLAILVIGAIVGVYLWNDLKARPDFSSQLVKKGSIEDTISINGKVQPIDSADLGFERGGKVVKLTHAVGDPVRAGEVLAVSNSDDLEAQLKQAVAQKNSAAALLAEDKQLASKENYKLKAMQNDDTSSSNDKRAQKEQINAQKSQVQAQEALVQAADDNIANIKAQIEKAKIVAPFDGILARQDVDLGEVAPSSSAVATVIGNSGFEIKGYVSQIDAQKIEVGQVAQFTLDTDHEKIHKAKVVSIDPAETDINGVSNYQVTLEIADSVPGLKSGISASVALATESKNNVIVVPQEAIYSENNEHFAYVSMNGLREKRQVETGISGTNNMVEIVSGLKEGDEIFVVSANK